MLEKAIQIALSAHHGQVDRGGDPYILHPLRVMLGQKTETAKICAILHDVIEDTAVTLEDLRREGFREDIIDTVKTLTKLDGEDYEVYIQRVIQNKVACQVKLMDLKDNMDLSRLDVALEADFKRYKKYEKAKATIITALETEE